ncbi:hypothetical protein DW265_06720 [Dorea longicatena]|uniref:Uncharacterized protein n=1 Tax=Dorea longicatena TaxID=88431 RepID=A0A414SWJ3_9FIRM|nr:hypothetical protein [Dorea longicatena]RHG26291.1 hypothetical protein DW265_06720 [Dorea longicatena]
MAKNSISKISNAFSTGGGGVNFEQQIQAMFLLSLLIDGFCPAMNEQTKKVHFQAKHLGHDVDDLVVITYRNQSEGKMACQIKHSITATEKDKTFQEVICAAWNDFNKEDFDRDRDRISLVTAQISNKAQQSLRFLHVEAIGAIDAEAFMERIDVPVFSNNDNQKMLAAIKECISLAKGCEPTNEEVWKFCKAFILLLFDMDCAESVNCALSASLIKCNSPENPILVWSRLVEYAGQCNQAAASVSKENIDRNIRDLFSKNNIIQLPPDPITAIDLFIPTIALIGAWKEDNEFDRKMIEQISGMEYSEFEAKARTMLSQNSEYLQLMNGNWKVCHKEELLNQCKNKLFDDSIGKLLEAVESILRQKSKCVASKMPYFIPVSGEYDNSLELRGNLVKSLCWVKKNLSELSQCNQEKIENNIYTLVSTLLQDAKWITWTSLRDCLQNLAELSPEAFLKEAERGIINNPTEIVNLFPPKSGELSGINYISNLLWALEILAWSPEYLVHSISVLGLLEALPYERTNWTNTPINSIVSILLPWYPQTMADLEKRKNALKCLKTDNPRVFWSTLKKLLPNKTRSTSGNPRPKYLKLEIPEEAKVTNAEAHECYVYLVELAVDTARNENEKLVELIDQLGYMYEPTLTDYLECLENSFEFGTDENTFEVWLKLRECMARIEPTEGKVIYKHLDRIQQLIEKMEPTDIRVKHREWYLGNRYLFDKGNYVNRWKMLEDKKLSAVKEIFDEYGSEEVERFGCAVKNVHDVANKLGRFLQPNEMSSIIEKCFIGILSKEFTINCLISFVYTQGAEKLLETSLCQMEDEFMLEILSKIPFSLQLLDVINQVLDDDTAYWEKGAMPYGCCEDEAEELKIIVEKLIACKRYVTAVNIIGHSECEAVINAECIYKLMKLAGTEESIGGKHLMIMQFKRLLDGFNSKKI